MKREGLAASSSAQASQPSRPANPFPFSHPRVWPTSSRRPSMPAQPCTMRVRCDAELLSLPARPHLSAFLFIFFTPTHQPPTRPKADSIGRSRPGGHARGMALVPPCAALTQPHATVGCVARLPTARCRSPLEAWCSAYKRRDPEP